MSPLREQLKSKLIPAVAITPRVSPRHIEAVPVVPVGVYSNQQSDTAIAISPSRKIQLSLTSIEAVAAPVQLTKSFSPPPITSVGVTGFGPALSAEVSMMQFEDLTVSFDSNKALTHYCVRVVPGSTLTFFSKVDSQQPHVDLLASEIRNINVTSDCIIVSHTTGSIVVEEYTYKDKLTAVGQTLRVLLQSSLNCIKNYLRFATIIQYDSLVVDPSPKPFRLRLEPNFIVLTSHDAEHVLRWSAIRLIDIHQQVAALTIYVSTGEGSFFLSPKSHAQFESLVSSLLIYKENEEYEFSQQLRAAVATWGSLRAL